MNISALSSRIDKLGLLKKLFVLCLACCLFAGCKSKTSQSPSPRIAVANSYLSAAVKDLCPQGTEVLMLVPPGMCPGHFDISPSQVSKLCDCKLLLLFDFQQNIEDAVPRIKQKGLEVCAITPSPGLCIPQTYLSVVKQVAEALTQIDNTVDYQQRLADIELRINTDTKKITEKINLDPNETLNVVASTHQTEFAKWLGLNVIAEFLGTDSTTPAQINELLKHADTKTKIVIANTQEGTRLAQSLAQRLDAELVVFSNFPLDNEDCDNPYHFDRLLGENINNLSEALR